MATIGLDYMNGILAFMTAIILFVAAGFSMFIRMKIPQERYSVVFPYLTVGMFLLGFMMVAYSLIFLTHKQVVVALPTILFFIATVSMMIGVYKVTEELGKEEARRAQAAARKKAAQRAAAPTAPSEAPPVKKP
jgi:membrane protein required for beta-lactamase induction